MTDDVAARERAQLALSRLRDPHGYDLWWLARREVFEPRAWHLVFPALALTGAGSARRVAVVARAGAAAQRSASRDHACVIRRIGGCIDVAVAFRQLAPIIATGQALAFLEDACDRPDRRATARRHAGPRPSQDDRQMGQRRSVHVLRRVPVPSPCSPAISSA